MKRIYLALAVILVLVMLFLDSCSATSTTFSFPPNQVLNAQTWDELPANGTYVQARKTLTLSWSADSGLVGYIFTENQYNNWKQSLETVATYEGYQSGSQGSITVTIQNSDTYYAVLYNHALSILGIGPAVKVYQATLIER